MSSFFPKNSGTDQSKAKKHGSRAFRAKKFMASALASSSTGRSTLGKLVGRDGEDLLKALVAVEEVRGGQEGGKKLNVDVFKVAGKVGLLISVRRTVGDDFMYDAILVDGRAPPYTFPNPSTPAEQGHHALTAGRWPPPPLRRRNDPPERVQRPPGRRPAHHPPDQ